MKRAASVEGAYRYTLSRQWDEKKPGIAWVMLNPSTADGMNDDPTIRRCLSFSERWGFGTMNVVNLFAFRATDPAHMIDNFMHNEDIVGPKNDAAISHVASISSVVVLAWGTNQFAIRSGRINAVWKLIAAMPNAKVCLGVTQNGSPRHPLYVAGDTKVKHWAIRSANDTEVKDG